LLLSAHAKEDPTPIFTPVSVRFTIHNDGFVRYSKHNTALLPDLQLRKQQGF